MTPNAFTAFLKAQLDHATWEGFHFLDLIFPLFLFIVGISIVFSLSKTVAQGGRCAALMRIARRSVLLFLLAVFYYGGWDGSWPTNVVLWGGVLQRIALCYFVAALIFLFFRPAPWLPSVPAFWSATRRSSLLCRFLTYGWNRLWSRSWPVRWVPMRLP